MCIRDRGRPTAEPHSVGIANRASGAPAGRRSAGDVYKRQPTMCGSCWSSTSRHKGTLNLLPLLRRGLFTSHSHPAQGTSPAPAFGRLKNPGPALGAYFPLHSTGKPAIICLEDCIFLPGRGLCGPPCSYRTPEGGILMQKLIIAIVSNEDSTAASRALDVYKRQL